MFVFPGKITEKFNSFCTCPLPLPEKVVKLTKKDFYAAIKEFIVMSEETKVGNLDAEEVIAFIDKTVEQIENKAAKAKEKAAEAEAQKKVVAARGEAEANKILQ